MRSSRFLSLALLMLGLILASANGCKKERTADPAIETFEPVQARPDIPKVRCVYSAYSTWSMTAAANDFGDFDEREGWLGQLEQEQGVDLVLERMEYLDSINAYASGSQDCVMLTNTDAQAAAAGRHAKIGDATVAVHATSHSVGADKLLVAESIKNWSDLYDVAFNLAEGSVTHYLLWRGCTLDGNCDYEKLKVQNVAPDKFAPTAATDRRVLTFGGWSPETFTVMNGRPDMHELFSSDKLGKFEIVDMIVFGQRTLDGSGQGGARVIARALDKMIKRTQDPAQKLAAFRAISRRFSNHPPDVIERALTLTIAFTTEQSPAVLMSKEVTANNDLVTQFSLKHGLITEPIKVGWGRKDQAPDAWLRFDPSYLGNPTR